MKFAVLPTELKVMIMSYFTPQQKCSTIAPVCKEWNNLAYDYATWKVVQFDDNSNWDDYPSILSKARPRRVIISDHDLFYKFMLTYFPVCDTVKVLECRGCAFICPGVLDILVRCFPNIEKFVLQRDMHPFRELCRDIRYAENWKCLKYLEVDHVSDEFGKLFLAKIVTQENKRFEEIYLLKSSEIYDCSFKTICTYQKEYLQKFSMHFEHISTGSYQYLSLCVNLKHLAIYHPYGMSDVQLLLIMQALKNLTFFRLQRSYGLFGSDFQQLFKDVTIRKLVDLDIDKCVQFDDGALKLLVKCSPSLKALRLERLNKITDVGLESLVDVGSQLEELQLRKMKSITRVCLNQLEINLPNMTICYRYFPKDKI